MISPDPATPRSTEIARLLARQDRSERVMRIGAVFLALTLHVGAAAWMAYRGPSENMDPPGDMEITVDLAPAALEVASVGAGSSSANAVDAPEAEPVEELEEIVEAIEPQETTPTEVVEAEAVEPETAEIEEIEAIEAPVAEQAEVVVAAPVPKPAPKPPVKRVERVERKPDPKPVERKVEPRRPAPSVAQQAGTRGRTQSDVGGRAASGDPRELNRYYARVRATLMRRKRYPSAAGSAQGIATVQFTISSSGSVVRASLTRSSGNAALDQAALSMARGGSFPPIPDSVGRNQVTLSAPVNFTR